MRTCLRRAVAVLVAIASSSAPAIAGPPDHLPPVDETADDDVEPVTAEDWLKLGLTRFEREDYAGAIAAFQRGHAVDPRPQFLFAIAQAERLRGDCKTALVYYRRFLVTSPPEEQATAAQQHLRRCSAVVTAQPAPPPEPAPPPPPPPPEPAPEAPPFWTDPITLGAGAGALALALTGAGFIYSADSAADDAAAATSYEEHGALRDRAASRERIGVVTLSAGAVLAGYTIYRIVRGGDPPRRAERHAVEVAPGPGVGLALGGRF